MSRKDRISSPGFPNQERETKPEIDLPQMQVKKYPYPAELVELIFKRKDSKVLCVWLPQVEFKEFLENEYCNFGNFMQTQ